MFFGRQQVLKIFVHNVYYRFSDFSFVDGAYPVLVNSIISVLHYHYPILYSPNSFILFESYFFSHALI